MIMERNSMNKDKGDETIISFHYCVMRLLPIGTNALYNFHYIHKRKWIRKYEKMKYRTILDGMVNT